MRDTRVNMLMTRLTDQHVWLVYDIFKIYLSGNVKLVNGLNKTFI